MRRALACLETTLAGEVWGEAAGWAFRLWEHFAAVPPPPSVLGPAGGAGPGPGSRGEARGENEEGPLCDGVTICQGQCDLSPHSPTLLQRWASPRGSATGSCLPATIAGCAQEFVKLPPVPSACYLCPVAPTLAGGYEPMRPGLNFAGPERIFLAQTE